MPSRTTKPKDIARAENELARAAESYPDVIEEGPWGHRAFKIQKKTFMFLSTDEGVLSFSLKLPASGKAALSHGFAQPTRYGLGKSGWVTARFASGDSIPISTIVEWIDESFRAIAPKKALSSLPSRAVAPAPKKKSKVRAKTTPKTATKTTKRSAAKKGAAKKA